MLAHGLLVSFQFVIGLPDKHVHEFARQMTLHAVTLY